MPKSKKDPYDTVERLTNALEAIATHTGTAKERCDLAWSIIAPLDEKNFPLAEDKTRFKVLFDTSPSKLNNDQAMKEFLESVWELYWRMSSNEQYS